MAMKSIEQLLQTPYWIIDVLPERVPSNSPGQVFSVERFFLQRQLSDIKQKHINIILKLNCYLDLSLDDDLEVNSPPEKIAEVMKSRYVNIRRPATLKSLLFYTFW